MYYVLNCSDSTLKLPGDYIHLTALYSIIIYTRRRSIHTNLYYLYMNIYIHHFKIIDSQSAT